MTSYNLSDLFFSSSVHQTFNAKLRLTTCKQTLRIAAEQDAAAFLLLCPHDLIVLKPIELAQDIAADFLDRWPIVIAAQSSPSNLWDHVTY